MPSNFTDNPPTGSYRTQSHHPSQDRIYMAAQEAQKEADKLRTAMKDIDRLIETLTDPNYVSSKSEFRSVTKSFMTNYDRALTATTHEKSLRQIRNKAAAHALIDEIQLIAPDIDFVEILERYPGEDIAQKIIDVLSIWEE